MAENEHQIGLKSRYGMRTEEFSALMKRRVLEILLVASHYDAFVLEEEGSAVQHPLRRDRVLLGPDQPIRADESATLLVHPTGVLLGRDGATEELEVDTPFTLGGRRYIVRRAALAATEMKGPTLTRASRFALGGFEVTTLLGGTVTPAYNNPSCPDLKLSQAQLADIFLGKIWRWDDPRIVAANPHLKLPAKLIQPIVRRDSSGTRASKRDSRLRLILGNRSRISPSLASDAKSRWRL